MNPAVHEAQSPDHQVYAEPASEADRAIDAPIAAAQTPWHEHFAASDDEWNEPLPETPHRRVIGGFLIFLSLVWTGAVAWAAGRAIGSAPLVAPELVRWAAIASGPLALLGLGWLLFGRSSRGETMRFTRSVQAMRAESEALQGVLRGIGAAIADNRVALAEESARLMSLGEETAGRLGAVTRDVDAGAQAMVRYADLLDRAAGSARTDIGVLLADIPRAEALARTMSETLRSTGLDAHQQAGALEAQLGVLGQRAREADEAAAGAAGRLTAHIAQVESAAETATAQMEASTAAMSAGVDATMNKAADGIAAVRQGLDEQGGTMLAMVAQASAALDHAGHAAADALAARADAARSGIDERAQAVLATVTEANAMLDHAGVEAGNSLVARIAAARAHLGQAGDALLAIVARASAALDAAGTAAGTTLAQRIEVTRQGLAEQGTAMRAMIEETSEAADRAAVHAGNALIERVASAQRGLEEQGAAMIVRVDESNAAVGAASMSAAAGLDDRVAHIAKRIEALGERLAEQDVASHRIIGGIDRSMIEMETRFSAVSSNGETRMAAMAETVESLSALVDALLATMAGGDARVADLTGRTEILRRVLGGVADDLTDTIPSGLADVENRTQRTREAAQTLVPQLSAMADAAAATHARLAQTVTLVAEQRGTLDALVGSVDVGLQVMQARAGELGGVLSDADAQAAKLTRDTGPQLIDALLRVRDAANQATERAREAIATAIPDAAAKLGEASGAAMSQAIAEQVATQMIDIGALAGQAVETARAASERLTRQMVMIGETTAAVETRIAEAQVSLRESDSEQFSRRVALLIESLNSTAIDVTKILSNEVTDSAWAQYLKGDRGVFTRRAVRLLDNGEAREIARHYEEEPEFREQVNRYIHDFEALLRRVLAERDGSPLGVTLLSSDMGKLYVALAQAIERIRG